ncbi:hypothetical protein TELCIR_01293 [Teladorsagia circumcincta]|uniref:Transposase n=1 Tax=Teladorsagia circumcincta TaxID=45464 RepID=A0A2G9V2M6_TELCI|nr:hypothetical protein TELCIR_01293 [Teladorsagia circumcincta]
MASTLGVQSFTIESGLKKLGMKKKLGRYAPHHLKPVDRDRRVDACLTLLNLHKGNRWLKHLISGDEKWIHYNIFHRKAQWVGRGETPKEVPKDVHPEGYVINLVETELTSYFASCQPAFWRNGIYKLPERWQEVVDNEGGYGRSCSLLYIGRTC